MFTLWLKSNPTASWEDLISALKTIGENTLAKALEEKYCHTDEEKKFKAAGNARDMYVTYILTFV